MKMSDFQSPHRDVLRVIETESVPTSPPVKEDSVYPWNWGERGNAMDLSPATSARSSPDCNLASTSGTLSLKRGRPRADNITNLIVNGSKVNSAIRCKVCNRVFPREKSLSAHLRTHTGE